jgi:hypothetical protein
MEKRYIFHTLKKRNENEKAQAKHYGKGNEKRNQENPCMWRGKRKLKRKDKFKWLHSCYR